MSEYVCGCEIQYSLRSGAYFTYCQQSQHSQHSQHFNAGSMLHHYGREPWLNIYKDKLTKGYF